MKAAGLYDLPRLTIFIPTKLNENKDTVISEMYRFLSDMMPHHVSTLAWYWQLLFLSKKLFFCLRKKYIYPNKIQKKKGIMKNKWLLEKFRQTVTGKTPHREKKVEENCVAFPLPVGLSFLLRILGFSICLSYRLR